MLSKALCFHNRKSCASLWNAELPNSVPGGVSLLITTLIGTSECDTSNPCPVPAGVIKSFSVWDSGSNYSRSKVWNLIICHCRISWFEVLCFCEITAYSKTTEIKCDWLNIITWVKYHDHGWNLSFGLTAPFCIFSHNIFIFHHQHSALENFELFSIHYTISTNMWRDYSHNCHNKPVTSYYSKERFENFEISATFHDYINVVTRWHRRGKTF